MSVVRSPGVNWKGTYSSVGLCIVQKMNSSAVKEGSMQIRKESNVEEFPAGISYYASENAAHAVQGALAHQCPEVL